MNQHPEILIEKSPRLGRVAVRLSMAALLLVGLFEAAPAFADPQRRAVRSSSSEGRSSASRAPSAASRVRSSADRVRSSANRVRSSASRGAHHTRQIFSGRSRGGSYSGRHARSYPRHRYGYGHRYRYGYRYGHYYRPYRFYYGYFPYFYPFSYYSHYGPYSYYPRYRYRGGGYYYGDDAGALDLNVKPKRAEVFVNGELVGQAKDFDGFPSYLWLDEGTYELAFYLDGYATPTQSYRVLPGSVVKVRLRLEAGEGQRPEAPEKKVEERYSERSSYDDEEPARWRRDEHRGRNGVDDRRGDAGDVGDGSRDVRGEPGRVRLSVVPPDASVYLDGRFLGSGQELADLHAGLIVEPGEHRLEVVRPGYASKEIDFSVESGREVDLSVELDR